MGYDELPKTVFIDIDGVILRHNGGNLSEHIDKKPEILPDVLETLNKWESSGYIIIVTTSRKESLREFTEKQLLSVGVSYDQLIMGLSMGERILINDSKPDGTHTARSIQLKRNEGLKSVTL